MYKVELFSYFSLASLASLHGDNKCGRGTDIRDEKARGLVPLICYLGFATGPTGE